MYRVKPAILFTEPSRYIFNHSYTTTASIQIYKVATSPAVIVLESSEEVRPESWTEEGERGSVLGGWGPVGEGANDAVGLVGVGGAAPSIRFFYRSIRYKHSTIWKNN